MKLKMMKKRTRPTIKHGTEHITPADGNIFLDLGFPPEEAAELLEQARNRAAAERGLQQLAQANQKKEPSTVA